MSKKTKLLAFNINDYVLVKMLPKGFDIWLASHNRYAPERWRKTLADLEAERDEAGYSKFQCWEFMQVFGPHMSLGMTGLFSTEILLSTSDLKPARPTPSTPTDTPHPQP